MAKWVELARNDLQAARAMLVAGQALYTVFCCQQAVEKALKALIVERTADYPPRLHALPRLAQTAGLALNEDQLRLMASLSNFYLHSRYPEEIEVAAESMTSSQAETILLRTEELTQWLISMLK